MSLEPFFAVAAENKHKNKNEKTPPTTPLRYNKLTGLVPTEIGQLAQLQRVFVGRNSLSGPLPGELGGLQQLRIAEFHNNRLSGVPVAAWAELGGLKRLTELKLQGNQIRDGAAVRAEIKSALGPMCYIVI